jgi:hypothetical protein
MPVPWTTWAGRPAWPRAYVISLALHLVLILALGLIVPRQQGVPWGSAGQVSISLDSQASDANYYSDELGNGAESAPRTTVELSEGTAGTTEDAAGANGLAELFAGPPPVDPSGALPRSGEFADVGGVAGGALGDGLRGTLSGPGGTGRSSRLGGKAQTSVFGVAGEGYKFIYVFDRSGSMGGSGRSALAAAKAELKSSLAHLEETHQFQIIFYNQEPTIFPLAGQSGRLVFGNEANKARAVQFIDQIAADGATRHEEALVAALRMGGDVIFFLTDADQPEMTPRQLDRIERLNNGQAAINTIEFGLGPQIDTENFLVLLARQNGGQHVYFDVSKLPASRP